MVSRWPKSPFWYRDLFFGIEILHSVVPFPGMNLSLLFRALTSCKEEVKEDLETEKKIEKSRYLKKDISIPTKRVTLNKRCFLNGVFQSGVFRGWPGSARAEGTQMPENAGVFGHSLSPWKRFTSGSELMVILKRVI